MVLRDSLVQLYLFEHVYEHNFLAMEITPIRTVQLIKTDDVSLPCVLQYTNAFPTKFHLVQYVFEKED